MFFFTQTQYKQSYHNKPLVMSDPWFSCANKAAFPASASSPPDAGVESTGGGGGGAPPGGGGGGAPPDGAAGAPDCSASGLAGVPYNEMNVSSFHLIVNHGVLLVASKVSSRHISLLVK